MKRFLLIALICFAGCSQKKPDDILPGARPMLTQLQKQIEWKKAHNVTREQADAMCHRWMQANDGKSVEQFWQYAVTVDPSDLM